MTDLSHLLENQTTAAQATPAGEGTSEARKEFQIDENTDLKSLSEHELYVLTQQLKDEQASQRPLISAQTDLSELRAEYTEGNQVVVKKIDWLASRGYNGLRRTRGDGDCFYRSLGFAYVERIMTAEDVVLAVAYAKSVLEATLPLVEAAGFEKMVFEDFYDSLIGLIDSILIPNKDGKTLNAQLLLEFFQNPETSNSVVVYLRMLTSAIIRTESQDFEPFLFHPDTFEPISIREFCERFVEATGKEADHVQMTALSRALKFGVHVAVLDGSGANTDTTAVDFVKFEPTGYEENGSKPVVLLFRPGHYDILETTKSTA